MNPFMNMYGAPTPRPAKTTAADRLRSDLSVAIANNSIASATAAEDIVLDGESYTVALALRYGYSQRLEFAALIPLIYHSEGYLDNFIENWHDVFGLTNSRRNSLPSNALRYDYAADGVSRYAISHNQGGIGDLVLSAKYAAFANGADTRHLAYALDVKVPSGDPDELTGSGAVDTVLSLHADDAALLSSIHTTLFGGGGVAFLGNGEILPDKQEDTTYSAYLGGAWRLLPALTFNLQLNYQSAIYTSDLKQLGEDSLQLYVGGSYFTAGGTRVDFAIGENLYTDPTPDFLVYFSLSFDGEKQQSGH